MPAFYLRSLGFLFAVIVSCDGIALGTDHWGSHVLRHTCNGNCGVGYLRGSTNQLDAVNANALSEDGFANLVTDQAESTHLFLSVLSADGVKKFSSGVMRSGKIEYGPLTFEMNSTSGEMPSEFRMLLDGEAAHPEAFEAGTEWQGTEWQGNGLDNAQGWSRRVQWNCPPLGRHSIQFEVRLKDRLVTSEQLWIEIVAPLKPEVVAVGSNEIGTSPIKPGKIVTVYQDTMVVRFAMPAAAEMIMHRPGLEDLKVQAIDECCFQFDLKDLSVGRHGVKFSRVVGTGCSMTSELSDTLWIQYEPTQALHSIRNENALRRRAIVDEIRSIAASSRPAFDESMMYNGVTSKYSTLDFHEESQPHLKGLVSPSGIIDVQPEVREVVPAGQPTNPVESPSDHASESSEKATEPPLPPPKDPNQTNAALGRNSHLVAMPYNKQHPQVDFQTERMVQVTDEPSKLLRERSQLDADRLSKFEDDLSIAESVWRANKVVSHVIFDAPAYFAQNGYGTSGEEDARNGLVLLEGMELNTQASGHWELKIPYIKSMTPAVLHLQIQFKTADGYWKPLTLQPVCFKAGRPCIDPNDCNCAHSSTSVGQQNVRCECSENGPIVTLHGYSPIMRREVGVFTDVRRRGSVVFGHGYAALEDRRSF